MKEIVFSSGNFRLVFSARNGALRSFQRGDCEHLKPAAELFSLTLDDGTRVHSRYFTSFTVEKNEFCYSAYPDHPEWRVRLRIRCRSGRFYFRYFFENMSVRLLDPLVIICADNGVVLSPFSEGLLSDDAHNRIGHFQPEHYVHAYPGRCQMQFIAHLLNGGGIFFAALDKQHAPKMPEFFADSHGKLRLAIETFGSPEFEYLLTGFDGDWMDAAEIYRNWVESYRTLPKHPILPKWLDESPVTMVVTVRGGAEIADGANEYFPYTNILPHAERLAEAVESKLLVMLMRVDQHGPWLPPYVWPPMGGEEALAKLTEPLHRQGHHIGIYGSGADWTQRSTTNDYSGVAEYRRKKLARFMVCGLNGKPKRFFSRRIRMGYHLCLTESFGRNVLLDQIRAAARNDIDVYQIFDQDLGGGTRYCFSHAHHHPPHPSAANTKAMKSLLAKMQAEISALGKNMLLGTECAAAEPFIEGLAINDLRPQFAMNLGNPVPLYQYVFHEYTTNFMGNQCQFPSKLAVEKCPDNFLWRMGYAFHAGDMLTVPLRENGLISWGAADGNATPPEQEPILRLLKNLNAMRRKYPEYLRYGRMIKTLHTITSDTWQLHLSKGEVREFPSVFHSSWEASDGRKATFLVNFLPHAQTIKVDGKSVRLPPLSALKLDSLE